MKTRKLYTFGKSSNDRIYTVSYYLKITARRALMCSPVDFGVPWMGGMRTAKEQNDIFNKGYSRCDGYEKKSNHQLTDETGKGKAIDLVPYIPGKGYVYTAYGRFGIIGMLMLEAWEELQAERLIPKEMHLHWGGFWDSRDGIKLGWDLAHFEIRSYEQKIRL